MRVPVWLAAVALVAAAFVFPTQARADMTIVVEDDDRYPGYGYGWSKIYIAPNGRTKVYSGGRNIYLTPGAPGRNYGPAYAPGRPYVAPNGRAPVYYGPPNGRAPAYYGPPNGRAPAYYGPPNGGRDVYVQPAARVYGPQPVYAGSGGPDYAYAARGPVVSYGGRPAPWTPEWYAYCNSKYRSFDPASGTFQPYHGPRRLCR